LRDQTLAVHEMRWEDWRLELGRRDRGIWFSDGNVITKAAAGTV